MPDTHARALGMDETLMRTIHMDVVRTGQHILFLEALSEPPEAPSDDCFSAFTGHIRRIERLLYTFASTNAAFSYLQGFNELVTPLYYVLTRGLGRDLDMCEAACFFLFQRLVTATSLCEYFTMGDRAVVVIAKMQEFEAIIRRHVQKVAQALQKARVTPLEFAFRWFVVLFAQDYGMPDLLVIWDALMDRRADIMEFVLYVAAAQLRELEPTLGTATGPSELLAVLHSVRTEEIDGMLEVAEEMWRADHPVRGKRKASPKPARR